MRVENEQNIFDFTLQEFGTLENLFNDVLIPNSLTVDGEIKPSQEINIDTKGKGNKTIKDQIQALGLIFTNGEIASDPPATNYIFEDSNNYIFEDGRNYIFEN